MDSPRPLNYQSHADFKDETGGVLRAIFGPGHLRIWQQFAEQLGAQLDPGRGLVPKPRLTARAGPFMLTLDVLRAGEQVFTRMRAPYVNPTRFRFALSREGFLARIGKLLGMQDIQVGRDDFDQEFLVRSNDEERVRRLLADPELRALLRLQPSFELLVKDGDRYAGPGFKNPIDELTYRTRGIAADLKTLHDMSDLVLRTLDLLRQLGVASPLRS
jgi:hypothetical protein